MRADPSRLGLLGAILGLFFAGGLTGALAFQRIGFSATVPLALLLMVLAAVPLWDDLGAGRF